MPAPRSRHYGVHRHDHEKIDGGGYQDERDHRVDEIADQKLAGVNGKLDRREIRLAGDSRDQRREEILYQRRDHRAKCAADHHGDGQIDYIASQQELLETLQHGSSVRPYCSELWAMRWVDLLSGARRRHRRHAAAAAMRDRSGYRA